MTVKQYIRAMWTRQEVMARRMGCDITASGKSTRVLNLSLVALVAVLVKVLVDKGVITDSELTAALNAARDDDYDDEPA